MTATISAIDKNASVDHLSLVRTGGNTTDVSPIRLCSIKLRLAIRMTSPGTQTSRLRCNNPTSGSADFQQANKRGLQRGTG